MQLRDFVTGGFTKDEVPLLEEAVENSAKAALCIISDGIDKAMNEYNVREKKPKTPKAPKAENNEKEPETESNPKE